MKVKIIVDSTADLQPEIAAKVGIQAFLNIAVVTNTIPNTGISLPFFSYGGTALIILFVEMGVVLAVSRYSYLQKQ